MIGGGKDLSFRRADVFSSTRHHEHGFFPSYRRLDVGIRLRPERFDLATWEWNTFKSCRPITSAFSFLLLSK